MQNLIFLNPILWIISFLIWLILLYLFYKTKNYNLKFKFLDDIEKVFWNKNKYFKINLALTFILITLFSILIANPNLKQNKTKINKNWIDIVLVLDLSYSMIAEDITPNRLEVAKEVLANFASELKTDRLWLILFSGKPFTSIPLTFDYDFVKKYVQNITIDSINQDYQHLQWTAIWDALLYGFNLFETSPVSGINGDEREKIIVLLTDWEANRWLDPLQAIKYIKEKNIKVHTVWIWWEKDTYVTINNIFWQQKIAIWWIDEKNLKAIASLTNWLYYRADSNETFKKIFEKLNLLQKKDLEIEDFSILENYYKPFIYAIFFVFYILLGFNFYFYLKN